LSETVFAKAAVSYRSTDGYLHNVLVGSPHYGERWGETESFSYRGGLRWAPNQALDVNLTIDGARDRNGATNREPVGSAGPLHNCGCASDPMAVNIALGGAASPYSSLADVEGFTRRDIFGASLKIDYDFDFATLTAISSYRQTKYHYLEDSSGLPASRVFTDLTGASGNPNTILLGPATNGFTFKITDAVDETPKQYTQELRLTSPTGARLDWITGLFYSREINARTEGFNFPALGSANRLPSVSETNQTNHGTAYAGYVQASYAVTDRLKLTGGARYSYEKKRITSDAVIFSGLPLLLQPYGQIAASQSWSNATWKVVAEYKLTEDAMAYANVSTGFKSGGFTGSASTAATASKPFDPEKATSYEVGAKTEMFEHRLRLNVSAFYTDYRDLQVTRFFQPAGSGFGQFITENAGKARIKGVEVEATARPARGVDVGGTFGYLDARYVRFTGTPSQNNTGSFDGNRLRQAPKVTASAFAGYTYTLDNSSTLSARASWKYQAKSYYDADNNPITVIPAYALVEGSLSYALPDGRTTLTLWGKNLGDKAYRTHVFSQRDSRVAFALFGEPRTYGLTLDYRL
jgi:iron complex outermembrane receptor protein